MEERESGKIVERKADTRRLVMLGLLVSLNVILTRFASVRISIGGVEGIRIGLGSFPVVFSGILFGPLCGAAVGALGDVVGFFLNPMGAYMPHFTLSAALGGAIPGMMTRLLSKEGEPGYMRLLIAIGTGQAVTSLMMVPWFLEMLFGIPPWATLPSRLISYAVVVPAYALFADRLCRSLGPLNVAERNCT